MKYNKVEIGERIRKNRKALGYKKQDDFIEALQKIYPKAPKDRGTIGSWENGDNLPDLDTMLAICELFDCDLSYLVGDIEAKTRDKQFIIDETGLSEEAIDILYDCKSAKDDRSVFYYFPEMRIMPEFLSFLITHKGSGRISDSKVLYDIISRIYKLQEAETAYQAFPKKSRKICEQAYFESEDFLGEPSKAMYDNLLVSGFEEYFEHQKHLYSELIKEFPQKEPEEILEELTKFFWILDSRDSLKELYIFRSANELIKMIEIFVQTSTALGDK